nr:ACP S-malonyltransferase [Succinivibrionaceae bacterium]
GAMAAVLGLSLPEIEEACRAATEGGQQVWAANLNCPGQVVISGLAEAVGRASGLLTEKGAKRVIPLKVSVPSHCPLMQPAADRLREALAAIEVRDAAIPVYCNAFAAPVTHHADLVSALARQLVGPVRWEETIRNLRAEGAVATVECGPGKVLCGLNRKIDREVASLNVGDCASLDAAVAALNAE